MYVSVWICYIVKWKKWIKKKAYISTNHQRSNIYLTIVNYKKIITSYTLFVSLHCNMWCLFSLYNAIFFLHHRSGLRGMCALLPTLGLTWVFGVLSLGGAAVVFQYLFAIFNSLQVTEKGILFSFFMWMISKLL